MSRGHFGIGIENIKSEVNLGTLWRSAFAMGANYTFTTGRRYIPQCSDTSKAWRHIPHYNYTNVNDVIIPYDSILVGIEIDDDAISIYDFEHPERAIYLLGAEDSGLSKAAKERCHSIIYIPSRICLNVSVAGSIVMYDRLVKEIK